MDSAELLRRLPNAVGVHIYDDLDRLSVAVARRIAELAGQAIAAHGMFHVALAGGETPRRCYEQLRRQAIDWEKVQVYFGDERCLPDGDKQRNDSMAREALLTHIAIPAANVHRIPAEQGAQAASAAYAATIAKAELLDLVLLGIGEDGHTASLFPGNPSTLSIQPVVPVFNAPKSPAERVSLGITTLNNARHRIILVAGSGKRAALTQILSGIALPVTLLKSAEWHLDGAALPT